MKEKIVLLAQTLADRIPNSSVRVNSVQCINGNYHSSVMISISTPSGDDAYMVSFDNIGAIYHKVL